MSPYYRFSALSFAVAALIGALLPTPSYASFRCGLLKRSNDSCRVIVCRPNPCQVVVPEECCLPNPCCNADPVVSVAETVPPVDDPIVLAQAETPAVAEAIGPPVNPSGLDPGVPTGHGVLFPGNNPMTGSGIVPPTFFGGGGGGGFGGGGGGGYPSTPGGGYPGGGGGGGNPGGNPGGGGGSGTEDPGDPGGEDPGGDPGGHNGGDPVHAPAPPALALGLIGSAFLWVYRRRVK